jgi:hypothetical protein
LIFIDINNLSLQKEIVTANEAGNIKLKILQAMKLERWYTIVPEIKKPFRYKTTFYELHG